jgi:hypothetical protein
MYMTCHLLRKSRLAGACQRDAADRRYSRVHYGFRLCRVTYIDRRVYYAGSAADGQMMTVYTMPLLSSEPLSISAFEQPSSTANVDDHSIVMRTSTTMTTSGGVDSDATSFTPVLVYDVVPATTSSSSLLMNTDAAAQSSHIDASASTSAPRNGVHSSTSDMYDS